MVPTERIDQGHTSAYSVYADINNHLKYDRQDSQIGKGLVSPQFVGRYESLPVSHYGTLSASIITGQFTIASDSDVLSRGLIST